MLFHTNGRQCFVDRLPKCGYVSLLTISFWLAIIASRGYADEVVYDNTRVPHRLELFGPCDGENFFAQPFELGDHNALSRIELKMARITADESINGTIHMSIWDDNGLGQPFVAIHDSIMPLAFSSYVYPVPVRSKRVRSILVLSSWLSSLVTICVSDIWTT